VAAALAALEGMQREPELRERLWANIRHVHGALKERGFKVFPEQPESAVMVIVVGADVTLRQMSKAVHEAGVFVSSVIYPAVAKNESRLRISLTAAHSRADLDLALDVLGAEGRRFGLI
jgi:glycine C-acetyltransferase